MSQGLLMLTLIVSIQPFFLAKSFATPCQTNPQQDHLWTCARDSFFWNLHGSASFLRGWQNFPDDPGTAMKDARAYDILSFAAEAGSQVFQWQNYSLRFAYQYDISWESNHTHYATFAEKPFLISHFPYHPARSERSHTVYLFSRWNYQQHFFKLILSQSWQKFGSSIELKNSLHSTQLYKIKDSMHITPAYQYRAAFATIEVSTRMEKSFHHEDQRMSYQTYRKNWPLGLGSLAMVPTDFYETTLYFWLFHWNIRYGDPFLDVKQVGVFVGTRTKLKQISVLSQFGISQDSFAQLRMGSDCSHSHQHSPNPCQRQDQQTFLKIGIGYQHTRHVINFEITAQQKIGQTNHANNNQLFAGFFSYGYTPGIKINERFFNEAHHDWGKAKDRYTP